MAEKELSDHDTLALHLIDMGIYLATIRPVFLRAVPFDKLAHVWTLGVLEPEACDSLLLIL